MSTICMINKELLKTLLTQQMLKIEHWKKEPFINRERLKDVKNFLGVKQNLVITGVRRCGKSVFLLEIINHFFGDKYYFINFEDERLSSFNINDFELLYETLIGLFGEQKVFFLDEVQSVVGWERWVRRMYDDGFRFFITGSNAKLLSKELATLLTGRYLPILLYPFSFKEFLALKNIEFKKEDVYIAERKGFLGKYFSEYLETGGFPEYIKDSRIEILQEYFHNIIHHDVAERYNIGNVKQLKDLARYLITNSGNLATHNKLRNVCDIKSPTTIIKYVSYLENAYLIFTVPYFSYSLKKQSVNPFKVYAIDIGLRNAVAFQLSKNTGSAYETIVAIHLKRYAKEIYYWKSPQQEEVDFVIKENTKIRQLIQVCYNIIPDKNPNLKNRELKALLKASTEFKCNNLLVITSEYDGEERYGKKTIRYISLWRWLLEDYSKI